MTRLEKLIEQLCPDGVNFKRLGAVAEIRSGWGFPNKEQGKKQGDVPFFKVGDMNVSGNELYMVSSKNYIDNSTVERLKCKPAPEGTIIFPKIGAAISTNKKRILVCKSCYDNNVMGLIAFPCVESRYLYYLIDSVDLMNFADYSGAMPSIRKSTLEKYTMVLGIGFNFYIIVFHHLFRFHIKFCFGNHHLPISPEVNDIIITLITTFFKQTLRKFYQLNLSET